MKIIIKTEVLNSLEAVWTGFDESLFSQLAPPFPPVKLLRFDGSMKGDLVSLELSFIFFKQNWTSLISEQAETEKEIYFIDKGIELPFFLKSWQHKHRLIKQGKNVLIQDEIEFKTPTFVTDFLFYPIIYAMFLYRKPIYKKIFNKN